ncbi:MAG TPA: lytic transglycosylase domain-containing protein [Candidatus Binataceae bacterium]|nr:lytic transglycosylase domain-containing protein [Candidatus Binataceae bacterium]
MPIAGKAWARLAFIGLIAIGVPHGARGAKASHAKAPTATDPLASSIAEASRRFRVPAPWIRSIIGVESHGDRRAVSPKGAIGLMQIMPGTWETMRARYRLGQDPFDPHDNIIAGTAFLRELHDRYGSPGFLAAYNAGPERYEDHRDRHRPLPAETVAYVAVLLPLIGGGDVGPRDASASDRLVWTVAPLFIPRSLGGPGIVVPGSRLVVEEASRNLRDDRRSIALQPFASRLDGRSVAHSAGPTKP